MYINLVLFLIKSNSSYASVATLFGRMDLKDNQDLSIALPVAFDHVIVLHQTAV